MKIKMIVAFIIILALNVVNCRAASCLDDLQDLPTAPGSGVNRFVKSHPILTVGAAISLICFILFNIDPGFKAKINKWVKKMQRMVNKKEAAANRELFKLDCT